MRRKTMGDRARELTELVSAAEAAEDALAAAETRLAGELQRLDERYDRAVAVAAERRDGARTKARSALETHQARVAAAVKALAATIGIPATATLLETSETRVRKLVKQATTQRDAGVVEERSHE